MTFWKRWLREGRGDSLSSESESCRTGLINPLRVNKGAGVTVAHPSFADGSYDVTRIAEYTRRHASGSDVFVDYWGKRYDAERRSKDRLIVRTHLTTTRPSPIDAVHVYRLLYVGAARREWEEQATSQLGVFEPSLPGCAGRFIRDPSRNGAYRASARMVVDHDADGRLESNEVTERDLTCWEFICYGRVGRGNDRLWLVLYEGANEPQMKLAVGIPVDAGMITVEKNGV